MKTCSPLRGCETERQTETEREQGREGTCTEGGSRRRRPDARRPLLLNSTMSGQSLFNTYQNNKLNSFCPLGHYIIWTPQGLCDNRLVAWLAWCKALLAEFLYRYAVWQHNVLGERWGCWIRVMQTDRVSWNMKPGRSKFKWKEKKSVRVRVSKLGRRRRRRRSTKEVGDEAQKLGERECESCAECKPEKEKATERCFLRGEMWNNTAYILRRKSYIQNGLLLCVCR